MNRRFLPFVVACMLYRGALSAQPNAPASSPPMPAPAGAVAPLTFPVGGGAVVHLRSDSGSGMVTGFSGPMPPPGAPASVGVPFSFTASPAGEGLTIARALGPESGLVSLSESAGEMEAVTFLGVETSGASPSLAAQLNLQPGHGLVVESIEAGSPAAAVFKPYDVLLKLDDQILIVPQQFAVLIRGHKEGDEVTFAYLRGGRQATARVKLGKHEVPKVVALASEPFSGSFVAFGPAAGMVSVAGGPPTAISRTEADRLLSALPHGPAGEPTLHIDNQGVPGLRAMSVNPANSELVYNDDAGTLRLTVREGKKSLVVTDVKGEQVFSGPVTSPEERKAMPLPLRERLEKLESLQGATFKTDGQFKGAETRVVVPKRPTI